MYYYNWRCNQLIDEFDIDLSEHEKQQIINIYDDSVLFADALLAELRERLDEFDPVFVVHGDHGEAFDEHGVYGHFYPSLYEENVRVPLVVSEGDAATPVERPISLLQLPELVERVGTDAEPELEDLTEDWVVATDYDGRFDRNLTAVRTRDLKYIRTTDGDETQRAFFDLASDPAEQTNLVGDDHPAEATLAALAARRDAHEREQLAVGEATTRLEDTTSKAPPAHPNQ
jgi:arylsulfatase